MIECASPIIPHYKNRSIKFKNIINLLVHVRFPESVCNNRKIFKAALRVAWLSYAALPFHKLNSSVETPTNSLLPNAAARSNILICPTWSRSKVPYVSIFGTENLFCNRTEIKRPAKAKLDASYY
jgi:hypothetical protein